MKRQINPYLLGAIFGTIAVVTFFVLIVSFPSGDALLAKNKVWVQFAAYTLTLCAWMVTSLRPRHASFGFWTFVAFAFIVHITGTVAFILYVRPLGPIDYVLYGPIEGLAIAFVWQRPRRDLRKD